VLPRLGPFSCNGAFVNCSEHGAFLVAKCSVSPCEGRLLSMRTCLHRPPQQISKSRHFCQNRLPHFPIFCRCQVLWEYQHRPTKASRQVLAQWSW
jgi:hypothetical protein